MNFFSLKINQKASLLNFFCLQGLTLPRVLAYRYPAPHKMGAGFSSLIVAAGSRYVSDKRFFCARNPSCDRVIMAGRDGETARSAGICDASLLTLSRPATTFSSVLARLRKFVTGAANMANYLPYLNGRTSSHLTPVRYPLFVWRFVSGLSDQNNTTYTITAASEREARLQLKPQLPAVRLIFAARIRLPEGTHHV
ncbi:host cell division inhibitor Icd-like protein [Salmonella enterica]|nr:host cell division inhibitor Icd-like protein [Salmonella enterica]ECQ7565026.1 host cell division inhibitor Icd-like protein [Salmonella enterica]EIS8229861.1 host cell division inhibitor Icd-like protein [Salmonella enterica]EJF4451063.1 host cell division inhibitor Icd-like protein [Salmonella enterica]EJP7546550.1 host cell division inhibitor Icd-like protein [Salmonella enterica]